MLSRLVITHLLLLYTWLVVDIKFMAILKQKLNFIWILLMVLMMGQWRLNLMTDKRFTGEHLQDKCKEQLLVIESLNLVNMDIVTTRMNGCLLKICFKSVWVYFSLVSGNTPTKSKVVYLECLKNLWTNSLLRLIRFLQKQQILNR